MELGALLYGNSDGPTKKAEMAALKFLFGAVFTVLVLLQHTAAVEGIRTQASGCIHVARHFGQRRVVKRDRYTGSSKSIEPP